MFRAGHRRKQCSEQSIGGSSVPSIEAGKEAMFRAEQISRQGSSVPSKEERWYSSEPGDLGYAANTCVFRAAEIIGSSEPAWFAW